MSKLPHILIVDAPYYTHIADHLLEGALFSLNGKATHDKINVMGALEIPAAIAFYDALNKYDGYIALGCVIRGETSHYDIVINESARALMDLTIHQKLAIGNGIITTENEAQALERAKIDELDKGGFAAKACLSMIEHRRFVLNNLSNNE